MSDIEHSGCAAAEEGNLKRESKLLNRTRNATKQAVVFDEDEDEDGGHVTTSILHQATPSLAKTWSPASAALAPGSPAGGNVSSPGQQSMQGHDDDDSPRQDPAAAKAAAKLRADRIAKRAAKLREIEDRNGGTDVAAPKQGFGRTFGGDYSDEPAESMGAAVAHVHKRVADNEKFIVSKLDHREVFGNRSSAVDGLLDLGTGKPGKQRKKGSGAQDGLDLDMGSMKRGGHMRSPRQAKKVNRATKQAEERRKDAYFAQEAATATQIPVRAGQEDVRQTSSSAIQPAGTHAYVAYVDDTMSLVDEAPHAFTQPPMEEAEEDEGAEFDDEGGPLGDMLAGMAKNLGNYGDPKELERELRALKAALAGEADTERDGADGGGGRVAAPALMRNKKATHHSSSVRGTATGHALQMRGGAPKDARASQSALRDDISSSDDSDDGKRARAPASRRPHVYKTGEQRAAAARAGV